MASNMLQRLADSCPHPMSEQNMALPVGLELPPSQAKPGPSANAKPEGITAAGTRTWLELLKWCFSFPAMFGVFLVGRVFYDTRHFFVDPDMWWHAQLGQNIVRTGHWPTADPFSFTVGGTPWLAYEWLGDVAIGFAARFGWLGLDVFLIALGSLVVLALYYFCSLRTRNSKAGFAVVGLMASLAIGQFNLRPQMFGYLFIILTLTILEFFRQGRTRALYFLPPLFLVWINTHGSWVVGMGIVTVTLLAGLFSFHKGSIEAQAWTPKQRRQLELALLGSLVVIPITPYGTELATYPFMVASSLPLNLAYVMEWAPMPFNILGGKFFLGLLILAFLLQAIFHFSFRLHELALALFGTAMACIHLRFCMLFVPFFAPVLASMFARWIPPYKREIDKYVLNATLMAGVVFAVAWYFPNEQKLRALTETRFPVRAVEYMKEHPVPGPMYNTYGFGGYLIRYYPEQKTFIDGRGDLFELGGAFGDYIEISRMKPAAFAALKWNGIRTCLLERNEPLSVVLAQQPDWQAVYQDGTSIIYIRKDSLGTFAAQARP